MKRRTSVNICNEYFFLMKHGKRNEYVEKLFDERLKNLKSILNVLRQDFSDDKNEIIILIELADKSAFHWEKNVPANLSHLARQALIVLWEETVSTGIEAQELIDVLWEERSGRKKRKKA